MFRLPGKDRAPHFWGRKLSTKRRKPCITHPFTWHFLPLPRLKSHLREAASEGPLKQPFCLEAEDKEVPIRQPLGVKKGRSRAGGQQDSLWTPGWPP